MYKILWLIIIIATIAAVQGLSAIPTRAEIVYANPKFLNHTAINVRRSGRGSNYHINLTLELLTTVGNNCTCVVQIYEILSGKYVMLPIRIQFKLCDFFNKDPLVGKVIMKQFPKNATCPFGPGWYPIHNITYENNLPFDIPFTFQAIETSICVDLKVNVEDTNERGLHIKIYLQVIQKPRNRKPS